MCKGKQRYRQTWSDSILLITCRGYISVIYGFTENNGTYLTLETICSLHRSKINFIFTNIMCLFRMLKLDK